MILSLTGQDCLYYIAKNYFTTIRYTMSPPGDISIAYRFSCDEHGLRLLHVWPLSTHHTASAISNFLVRSLGNSPSSTHSWVKLGRSIALGQSVA
ncbi:hypothetical protein GW17_00020891 [Ensete ventricosum]|nr:hypothetical protein GW17_00020891 [Ensete ventricosum]RZR86125.1 hypothetical protein BHM03_00013242 [Ensete ventricosum]